MIDEERVDDFLAHFGVRGMKWGVRKATDSSDTVRGALKKAKVAGDAAAKESMAKSRASSDSSKLGSGRKALNAASAARKAAAKESLKESKAASREKKAQISAQAAALRSKASFKEKMVYNEATHKYAAKLMKNKNMSEIDAVKKAKGQAWVNSAIATAAIGGYMVYQYGGLAKKIYR